MASGHVLAVETKPQPEEPTQLPPLSVGIPNLEEYSRYSGIGRVLWSLYDQWAGKVHVHQERFEASPLPILRNVPHGVTTSNDPDLIMLPQLTRAQGLRSTKGVPSIVIVHDVGIIDFPGDLKGLDWITRWSIRGSVGALRHATHIVTVSDFTRTRLLTYLPDVADRVTTIPNGVGDLYLNFDEPREASRRYVKQRFELTLKSPVLVYVGSEHPRKNFYVLLMALKRVKQTHPEAQLIKVGTAGNPAWRASSIRDLRKLGLSLGQDVAFVEGIDDSELARIYRVADLFVSASLYEGFGLPALESMAVGTPAVVSNRGALPEVIGDAGWVVEPDEFSMSRGILGALYDSRLEEHGRQGRVRAGRFRWKACAQDYLQLMHRVANTA